MTTKTETTTLNLAESLHEFADFLAANPQIMEQMYGPTFYLWADSEEEFRENNKDLGTFTKGSSSGYLDATKHFGKVKFQSTINKSLTCEKKVVGTRIVKTEVPMEEVEMVESEVEEYIGEWVCPETWR